MGFEVSAFHVVKLVKSFGSRILRWPKVSTTFATKSFGFRVAWSFVTNCFRNRLLVGRWIQQHNVS